MAETSASHLPLSSKFHIWNYNAEKYYNALPPEIFLEIGLLPPTHCVIILFRVIIPYVTNQKSSGYREQYEACPVISQILTK